MLPSRISKEYREGRAREIDDHYKSVPCDVCRGEETVAIECSNCLSDACSYNEPCPRVQCRGCEGTGRITVER